MLIEVKNPVTIELNINKTTTAGTPLKDVEFNITSELQSLPPQFTNDDGNITVDGNVWIEPGVYKYEVTENAEDYKSTPADAISDEANKGDAPSGTVASEDIHTGYLNTRNGVIPTGVVMTVAPFAAVTLLGGAGVVTMVMKKKKSSEEE
mgnify:CR=1 FL=1